MFRARAAEEFDLATAVLVETTTNLADPEATLGTPKDVPVLISG
jgi:hypothetical protein